MIGSNHKGKGFNAWVAASGLGRSRKISNNATSVTFISNRKISNTSNMSATSDRSNSNRSESEKRAQRR